MLRAIRSVLLAVVLLPVLSGIALADYIPESPDTLDIFSDPSKTPVMMHFYSTGDSMPVTLENLIAEEIFISGFIPDSLISPMIDYMVEAIMTAAPHAKPPLGIAGVVASWSDADSLTVGVLVGGDDPHTILRTYTYPLPIPSGPEGIPVERAIFAVSFNPYSLEKYSTRGTFATGIASGPGGESQSDGIDIHHPDKMPLHGMPDSLTVCLGGELGSACVRLRSDATLTPGQAIEILRELLAEVLEVSQAMAAAMNNNQQAILESGYEGMLSFYVQGQSECSEENYATACMIFEGGAGIGLPLGGYLRLNPRTVNLGSGGEWIKANVRPQDPYSAVDVDLGSAFLYTDLGFVMFNPTDPWTLFYDDDGVAFLRLSFPRAAVLPLLVPGNKVPVNCAFMIASQVFTTADTVKVVGPNRPMRRRSMNSEHKVSGLTEASGSSISFAVGHEGAHSRLDVFDLRGRLVTTLVDRHLPAGDYDYSWSGEDSHGIRLPSGVYFYRLQVDDIQASSKLILMR